MADWTPEELADQRAICECRHFKNTHANGGGACAFGPIQRAYGFNDPDCSCQEFNEVGLLKHTTPLDEAIEISTLVACERLTGGMDNFRLVNAAFNGRGDWRCARCGYRFDKHPSWPYGRYQG